MATRSLLAVLRFVLELILVAVYGSFGFAFGGAFAAPLGWVLGLGLPALVIVIWGTFVAPRASRRSSDPTRFALELALFFSGMAMLVAMSLWVWGVVLFVVFVIDRVLLDRLGTPAWAAPR
jgi:hypothetical protein